MTTDDDGEDVYPPLPGGEVVDLAEARARLLNRQQRRAAVARQFHPSAPSFEARPDAGVVVGADGRPFMTEYEPGRFMVWCAEGGCDIVGAPGGAMCLTCAVADGDGDGEDEDEDEGDGCEL